ncbi:Tyrocidine synthase 3 [compost metagenome]
MSAGGLGEVYIGGAQLCRGYLNRANADVFVADPFRAGERLYRTGDLAWVLPEGGLRLAGRADHQVKVHGYRVEPAEVEAALLARPGVRQAVVLAVPDAAGATTLAAFFVGDSEAADGRALREQLAALLPAHMVPASCTAVSAFARLPNGKIDRPALAASAPAEAPQRAVKAPRDALEALLADGMATLLGSGPVGVEDDFFELGGHSLQVIKLVARIRKLLQVEVAAGVVFDHPTPAALAAVLREASADAAALEQLAQAHRQRDLADESVGEAA